MFRVIEQAYEAFCEARFPLPDPSLLEGLEKRLGIRLPDLYRQFLIKYNGGYFKNPEIVCSAKGFPDDNDNLVALYGIGADIIDSELGTPDRVMLFEDNYPCQVLPIGHTFMGNLLLLVTHEEKNGMIILRCLRSMESCFVADNIEGFFETLRESDLEGY